jgi:prevent-host-death family protein
MRTMAAGQFKAKCLGLLDDVKMKRESVLVTKHGQPWAKLVPLDSEDDPLSAFRFPGKIEIVGDIMAPLYSDDENEAFFERSAVQLK